IPPATQTSGGCLPREAGGVLRTFLPLSCYLTDLSKGSTGPLGRNGLADPTCDEKRARRRQRPRPRAGIGITPTPLPSPAYRLGRISPIAAESPACRTIGMHDVSCCTIVRYMFCYQVVPLLPRPAGTSR